MRRAARAVVIHDGKLLAIHRNKFGTQYATLPGGAVEMGEEPVEAAIRELAEETSVQADNPRLVFIDHAGDPYGDQYIYLCQYLSGEPKLSATSIEEKINQMGQNLYTPSWLLLKDLASTPFVSPELKGAIQEAVQSGWPTEPKEFNSTRTI